MNIISYPKNECELICVLELKISMTIVWLKLSPCFHIDERIDRDSQLWDLLLFSN